MKFSFFTLLYLLIIVRIVNGQSVAINNDGALPHESAILDIQSTSKGVLIPRMTSAQRLAISNIADGLLVFDSTTGSFWFYSGASWSELADSGSGFWQGNGSNIYFNSGNVGIGDNTPAAGLTVGSGDKFQVDNAYGNVTFTDPLASIKFPATPSANNPMMYMFSGGTQNADRMVIGHSPSFPKWGLEYKDSNDVFFFRSTSSRSIAIELFSGHMGFGIEDPAYRIDLMGRMRLQSDGSSNNRPGIWFANQANTFDRALLGMAEPDSILGIYSQHLGKWAIEFEIMREPRIGIDIPNGSPPRSELHLYHTNFGGSNDGIRIQNEGPNLYYWNLYTSNTTGHFEFYHGGIKRATINPTSGAYTAVSDSRVKKNIEDLDNVLPNVMKIRPRTYQYTEGPDQRYFTGLLAQELEQLFPQFVYNGGDDQVLYSVDYGSMSVIALKAIQEQQSEIDALKEEIRMLKEILTEK